MFGLFKKKDRAFTPLKNNLKLCCEKVMSECWLEKKFIKAVKLILIQYLGSTQIIKYHKSTWSLFKNSVEPLM